MHRCMACMYAWLRARMPVWTHIHHMHINNIQQMCHYTMFAGSVSEICTSDHKPVFSTFDIGVASQYVSRECESPSEEADRSIVLQEITADVRQQELLHEYWRTELVLFSVMLWWLKRTWYFHLIQKLWCE